MNHHPHHAPYTHHPHHNPHINDIIHPHTNHNNPHTHISSSMIPQFNLSQLPQIPVIIPTNTPQPILSQSTTNNAFITTNNDIDHYNDHCIPITTLHVPNLNNIPTYSHSHSQITTIPPPKPPRPAAKNNINTQHRQPPKPPSPKQKVKQKINSPSKSDASTTSIKSRKRSLSEMKNTETDPTSNIEGSVPKKRKLTSICTGRQATNRVWRQTRQNAKFRMAIELLDTFRSDHGGKLPSLRAIMKMLKVGFPKAHEILDEYARHVGCSKDKLVQDMTIRQEKKNKTDLDGSRKKRINRNIFEYPINVNGKLQEIILNLLHQKKVCNMVGMHEMYLKMERSMIEFESFYEKFGLNDKLRLGQSYFMLAAWYFYDKADIEGSYLFVEKALSTFRDCNYLAINAGFTVSTVQQMEVNNHKNEHICIQDIGFFWPQIFEIYILGGHILLSSKQYYDAKTLYLFAYELVKYIVGGEVMNACVALEALSHVCALENNINECCGYIEQIIKILTVDMQKNKGIGIEIGAEEEEDNSLKLLNMRCYYSCILSLDYYENKNEFNMNKSLEIYREVVSECMDKFGGSHEILFGVYLYFAFHFINIEKFEYAFECIEFIKNEHLNGKMLSFDEMNGFQSLLNGFIYKLLHSQQMAMHSFDNKLKENCLKIFEYQLVNCDDINHYILNHKQEMIEKEKKKKEKINVMIKKEIKKEKKDNIKKEEEEEEEEEIIIKYMDKNEIIFEYQINLLLYKFNDFQRVKQFIDNFENNEMSLNQSQIQQFQKIKKDYQILKDNIHLNDNNSKHSILSYQNHNHNIHHNMQYDFNVLPNFLPMTAAKSMS